MTTRSQPPVPVWVTGARGLIGSYIVRAAPVPVIPLSRAELDLTDFAALDKRFAADRPQLIIHCAAMSRNPDCQANPPLAKKQNVEVTAHLAGLAENIDFIFFSTDLVFDGKKGNYLETDPPSPLTVYGETKVAAEQIVLRNKRHNVVRTSMNCGASLKGNHSFNEELKNLWAAGKTAKVFFDEFRCPIPAAVTAQAIWEFAACRQPGIYHLAGSERLSRVEIGRLIAARHPELHPRLEICSLREYQGAPRSPDASLNCDKIQKLLSFPLPGFSQWLKDNPNEKL